MSPIRVDEMLTIGEDLGLRKFTCKCSMERVDGAYRLPVQRRNTLTRRAPS